MKNFESVGDVNEGPVGVIRLQEGRFRAESIIHKGPAAENMKDGRLKRLKSLKGM